MMYSCSIVYYIISASSPVRVYSPYLVLYSLSLIFVHSGAKCGESLDAACLEEAVENVDDHNENTHNSLNSDDVKAASTPSSAATRGVVAALALAAGSMIIA